MSANDRCRVRSVNPQQKGVGMSMTSGYPEFHPSDREYYSDPYAPRDPEPIESRLKFREFLDHGRDVEMVESSMGSESAFLGSTDSEEIAEDYSGL